jgi:hypothetical protein
MKPRMLLFAACAFACNAAAQYIQLRPQYSNSLLRGRYNAVSIYWPDTTGSFQLEASEGHVESHGRYFIWFGCNTRSDTVTLTAWFKKGSQLLQLEKRRLPVILPPLPDIILPGNRLNCNISSCRPWHLIQGLRTECDLKYSDCLYQIKEFDVTVVKAGGGQVMMVHNMGSFFNGQALALITGMRPGDVAVFSNIAMQGSCERQIRLQKKTYRVVLE